MSLLIYKDLFYIHKQSNHPVSITRKIPAVVSKIISNILFKKESFDKAAPDYNNVLKNTLKGFDDFRNKQKSL